MTLCRLCFEQRHGLAHLDDHLNTKWATFLAVAALDADRCFDRQTGIPGAQFVADTPGGPIGEHDRRGNVNLLRAGQAVITAREFGQIVQLTCSLSGSTIDSTHVEDSVRDNNRSSMLVARCGANERSAR